MMTAAKLDPGKLHKADYVTPQQPVLRTIKPAQYLAVSGQAYLSDPRRVPPEGLKTILRVPVVEG